MVTKMAIFVPHWAKIFVPPDLPIFGKSVEQQDPNEKKKKTTSKRI